MDEVLSREAARLRTATRRAGSTSAVDAVVVAVAAEAGGVVLTTDPGDLGALVEQATKPVSVVAV